MASARKTLVQQTQALIKKQLLEGTQAQFFRGMGEQIVCADQGELLTTLQKTLAALTRGIVIEVTGGPAPRWGEESWNVEITIFEEPTLNRPGDGKTADTILDAVLVTFADGGAFLPGNVTMIPGEERVGWIVKGTSQVALSGTANPGGSC